MKYVNSPLLGAGLLLILGFVKPALAGDQADAATAWIRQMSEAMEQLTYQGTFIYIHGAEIETMSIAHDGKGERERLTSLNGEARVIIRDMDNVTCIWPGSKSVIVSKSLPRAPFPMFDTQASPGFADYYHFMMAGEDRVAGIQSKVVAMMPVDQYRYGYKLWVDKASKLLLRSMMLDSDERVIEQVMFTSLEFPESIRDGLFSTRPSGEGYEWKTMESAAPDDVDRGHIEFTRLPAGFNKVSEAMRPMRMNENPVRHAVVSDGVASVSVYVEYTGGEVDKNKMEGVSSMGAVHAYSRALDKAFVTVVGEVPVATVELIGEAVVLKH
ncbi:MAG: MucB/RseB C-terminal domain-containing protein [Gammaproteobacteria bacterium]|nr:MucB/RseB C-terminal domain-containing protein [Gammaproteobacteria bacterium]